MQVGLWSRLLFRKFDLGYVPWVQVGNDERIKASLMSCYAGN